jgi:hypothetical protein
MAAAAAMTCVGLYGVGGSWVLTASLALATYGVALVLVGGVSRSERMEMASVLVADTRKWAQHATDDVEQDAPSD